MARYALGGGLIVCLLVPVVLLLFGILGDAQAAAGVFLLAGLWTVVYGVVLENGRDKLYDIGFGVIVALLSTFDILPLQYVIGLVLLSVIGLVVTTMAMNRKPSRANRT